MGDPRIWFVRGGHQLCHLEQRQNKVVPPVRDVPGNICLRRDVQLAPSRDLVNVRHPRLGHVPMLYL